MNARLRPVVVLFHPDDAAIASLLALAEEGRRPLAVANAIDDERRAALARAGIEVLVNRTNIGLARAFNQGIARALETGADYVMLLDQDTRPPPGMAAALLERAEAYRAAGGRLGCLGPRPVDRKRPGAATFARPAGPLDPATGLVPVATIISSGMVIPRAALDRVGGMWNELFIDHIDHEWCFRAAAHGLTVLGAADLAMPHDMGDAGLAIGGRYKPVHRSPVRHFYIVRNTLWLARCSFIPRRWRILEAVKLAYRIPGYLLVSSARPRSLAAIGRALWQGVRGQRARTWSA